MALRVNPATVARAYRHLVEAGILSVRRGEGTFVPEGLSSEAVATIRRDELARAATEYARTAAELGVALGEAEETLRQVWNGERKHD